MERVISATSKKKKKKKTLANLVINSFSLKLQVARGPKNAQNILFGSHLSINVLDINNKTNCYTRDVGFSMHVLYYEVLSLANTSLD